MARPISSDIILVNRDGTDYKTTYTEANPSTCELPLLPGPPVIALGGQPQTKPAEVGDSIVIVRAGEGPDPSSYQWQRGLKQDWTDIPGETGIEYTVSNNDDAINIRLQQTFDDDSALYSNEIVIAEPPPAPWDDFSVIAEVTVTSSSGVFSKTGFDAAFVKDTEESVDVNSYQAAQGVPMIYAKRDGGSVKFTNSTCDFEFGALTNTQQVSGLAGAFKGCTAFTGVGIEYWDVGNVTNMSYMFGNARVFNQDISNWEVGNVTNMSDMFDDARVFNQDISNWEVGNVTDMSRMFYNARAFNLDISNWEVGNVTNMESMFYNARAFNLDISNWEVGNVTNMVSMFQFADAFNSDISNWNVGNVTNMYRMFESTRVFNSNISNWNVGNAKNTSRMFFNARAFNLDISNWNVGNVTNMINMFQNTQVFNSDISNWDVGNVVVTTAMFRNAQAFNSNISNWDVSNVTDMDNMFNDAQVFNQDLSNWCVTNITTEPSGFANGTTNWTESKPCWGHCPPKGDPCVDPWEGADAIYHVIVNNWWDINVSDQDKIYKLDNRKEYPSINDAGDWIITGKDTRFRDSTGNWEFGALTDTSNVTNMSDMFRDASAFNQNLTNWCVDPEPTHNNFRTGSAMPTNGSNDPVWGTCP